MAMDTTNLTGYAKALADTYNKTGSLAQPTWDYANLVNGGSGLRVNTYENLTTPGTGLSAAPGATVVGNQMSTTGADVARPLYRQVGDEPVAPGSYTAGNLPSMMDPEAALMLAKTRINPTYDSLRTKYEQSFAREREQIPQLLAARHGMSGTRGGRRQSSDYSVTQNENATIGDLESKRIQAQNDMAEAIQSQDWERASQLYQMQESARKSEYESKMDLYKQAMDRYQNDKNSNDNLYRWMYGNQLNAEQTAYEKSQDALANDWKQKEWDYETDPNSLDNQYKRAQIAAMLRSGNNSNTVLRSGNNSNTVDPTKVSKDIADGVIADMQNQAMYLLKNGMTSDDPNYAEYIRQKIAESQMDGSWNYINNTDKARILTLANQIGVKVK